MTSWYQPFSLLCFLYIGAPTPLHPYFAWVAGALCLPYVFTLSFIPPSPCTLFWEDWCRGSLPVLTFSYLKIGEQVCGAGNTRVGYWLLRDVSCCVACVPACFFAEDILIPLRKNYYWTDLPLSVSFCYVIFSLISLQIFLFLLACHSVCILYHLSHIRNILPLLSLPRAWSDEAATFTILSVLWPTV